MARGSSAIINGAHSCIKHLMIKSAGKIVCDTDNLHNVTFVKNLLEYSDDYSRSVAKNSLWNLDTDGTTAHKKTGFKQANCQPKGRMKTEMLQVMLQKTLMS